MTSKRIYQSLYGGSLCVLLLLLVGCKETPQDPVVQQTITLSPSSIEMIVGDLITLTPVDGGGEVEVAVTPQSDYTLTTEQSTLVAIQGHQIKALATGTATVSVVAGEASATLTIQIKEENQGEQPAQTLSIDPTGIMTGVGNTIRFGSAEEQGVDVVVQAAPITDFTLSSSDNNGAVVSGHQVTIKEAGQYVITVTAGDKSVTCDIVAYMLSGTWIGNEGYEYAYIPDRINLSWALRSGLKKVVTDQSQWLFDYEDADTQTLQFIDMNAKVGRFSMGFTHMKYVCKPGDGSAPYVECTYAGQFYGTFELIWVATMATMGFDIDPSYPPSLSQDDAYNYYYEAIHPELPIIGRITFEEVTGDDGSVLENIHLRFTQTTSH